MSESAQTTAADPAAQTTTATAQGQNGSSAQTDPSQQGSSTPTTETPTVTLEQLQVQLTETQALLASTKANNEKLLGEKLDAKRKAREAEPDKAKLADELKAENDTLTTENADLKKRLERYEESDRKAFKEAVAKIPDERLRAMYSDPAKFTTEDVLLLVERLSAQGSTPVPSGAAKPATAATVGTESALELAAANGDKAAINAAFDALLKKK